MPFLAHPMAGSALNFQRFPVYLAFLVSGACGLIHETVWTRLLRHVMGNTTYAITTALCAFMAGLALGSYLAGRYLEKRGDPLLMFALLEGAVGVYCLFLPMLISGTVPVYKLFYHYTLASPLLLTLMRFSFSGFILLIPAAFMGATLPILTRAFTDTTRQIGRSAGTLYAVNTFGAVFGAWTSGFIFVPVLGSQATLILACAGNLLVGLSIYLIYTRQRNDRSSRPDVTGRLSMGRSEHPKASAATPPSDSSNRYKYWLPVALLVGYGLSGFAALVYEIAWVRAVSMLIGSTVYAFSTMLTAFVLGLALGSVLMARWADRIRQPLSWLVGLQWGIGFSALLVAPVIGLSPPFVTRLIAGMLGSWWGLQAAQFALCFALMLVPTLLMGATFPLVSRLYGQRAGGVARAVGSVYAANTIGTILGAFAAGFFLIPWFGTQQTILLASSINVAVGMVFVWLAGPVTVVRNTAVSLAAGIAFLGLFLFLPTWDTALMSMGPYHGAAMIAKDKEKAETLLRELMQTGTVLFYKEDVSTAVAVKDMGHGIRSLLISGKPDASNLFTDMCSQKMAAHTPLLLHENPKTALLIGLASGISLGSMGLHDLTALDCVEISPAMASAARFFEAENRRILGDPRVNLIIDDGRNYLQLSDCRYDVITSQPSNPYLAGVADLFTREFFELCRSRLTENGIMCSWIQSYKLDRMTFASILKSFQAVFPDMQFWRAGMGNCFLVGSRKPLQVDFSKLMQRMQRETVGRDLASIGVRNIPDFLARFVMGPEGVRALTQDARIHTDDNALVEFRAPKNMFLADFDWELIQAVERNRQTDFGFLTIAEPQPKERELYQLSLERGREYSMARHHIAQAYEHLSKKKTHAAADALLAAAALNPFDVLLVELNAEKRRRAFALVQAGKISEAIRQYRGMIAYAPGDTDARYNLGLLLAGQGDYAEAHPHLQAAALLEPEDIDIHLNAAMAAAQLQLYAKAIKHYRSVLSIDPLSLPALTSLAIMLTSVPDSSLQNTAEAVSLAEKALSLEPKAMAGYHASGLALKADRRYEKARQRFEEGMALAKSEGDKRMAAAFERQLADVNRRP